MREIKFRAWDGADMIYFDLDLCNQKSQIWFNNTIWRNPVMQCTGIKDRNGVEIYKGDILNIFFTSGNGEYNHDCVYTVQSGPLGDMHFEFIRLFWECYGHNQYPSSTLLCLELKTLDYDCEKNNIRLKVPDSWGENHFFKNRWKENDISYYFELIGNIHENPELLVDPSISRD